AFFFTEVTGIKAQNNQVSGTVVDAGSGEALPGVNISIPGTTSGTSTDAEGHYSLQVPSLQDSLQFSFIGYETKIIAISDRAIIDVKLQPSVYSGEEMIVVGYGEQRSEDVTGAISTVSPEDLEDVNTTTFGGAIQGLVPGVKVNTSGAPGSEPSIEIRGLATFHGNDPLYIIDGVPTRANRDFNVNDIESVQILKD